MIPLGEAFLKEVPARPGIYLMLSEQGDLLYVGKAKNLRARLRFYARLKPGEDDRLDRMVAAVRTARWEECRTEADALRRETELIRSLRPPYNTTHAQLSKCLAIAIAEREGRIRFRLASEPNTQTPELMYFYPFAASTPSGLTALVRLLFMAQARPSVRDAPANVTRSSGCELKVPANLRGVLFSFLEGRSPRLLHLIEREVLGRRDLDDVRLLSMAKDLKHLGDFYRNGPRAVRRLQLIRGGSGPVSAAELTRLLVTGYEGEIGSSVQHDARTAEEQIVAYRGLGAGIAEIVARLNHSGAPRPMGSGRWRPADVLEVLAKYGPESQRSDGIVG